MGNWDYSKLTPARRRWLKHLRHVGRAERGRGTVGIACMRSGWTEWVWTGPQGQVAGTAEVMTMFGRDLKRAWWECANEAGWRPSDEEQLTEAGRAQLNPQGDVGDSRLTRDA